MMRSGRGSKKACPEVMEVGRFSLKESRGSLPLLSYYKPENIFKNLRSDIARFTAACVWLECLECLTFEGAAETEGFFELAVTSLQTIDQAQNARGCLKVLCSNLDLLLEQTGFGSLAEQNAGARKMTSQVARVEEASGRTLKTSSALKQLIEVVSKENRENENADDSRLFQESSGSNEK